MKFCKGIFYAVIYKSNRESVGIKGNRILIVWFVNVRQERVGAATQPRAAGHTATCYRLFQFQGCQCYLKTRPCNNSEGCHRPFPNFAKVLVKTQPSLFGDERRKEKKRSHWKQFFKVKFRSRNDQKMKRFEDTRYIKRKKKDISIDLRFKREKNNTQMVRN